jgi:crotonobetainyl-CoA:carnitine CoA-transferase CaiB-like acyl-CoA transferase
MQSGELVRYEGRPAAQRGGRDFAGPSPEQQFYPVSDGWVRVQAPTLAALGQALGLAGAAQADADAIASALADSSRAAVLERLNGAGIPATPARHTAEVVHDPAIKSIELLEEHRFPDGRPYLVPHRYARFSRTEQAPLADAPGVGEHSREVLAEAGLSVEAIDALAQERVVIEGAPFVLTELINYR